MGCCGSKNKVQATVPKLESAMSSRVKTGSSKPTERVSDTGGERQALKAGERRSEGQDDSGAGSSKNSDLQNQKGTSRAASWTKTTHLHSPPLQSRQTSRTAAEHLHAVSTRMQAGGASIRSFASSTRRFPHPTQQPMLPLIRRLHSRPVQNISIAYRSSSFGRRASPSSFHERTSSEESSEDDQRSVKSTGAIPDRVTRSLEMLQLGKTSSDSRRERGPRTRTPRSNPPTIKESSLEGSSHGSSRAARELAAAREAHRASAAVSAPAPALQQESTGNTSYQSVPSAQFLPSSHGPPQESHHHVQLCRCRVCQPRGYDTTGALRKQWSTSCVSGCLCPRCLASAIPMAPQISIDTAMLDTPSPTSPMATNCLGCANIDCCVCFPEQLLIGSGSPQRAARRRSGERQPEAGSSSQGEASVQRAKSGDLTRKSRSREGGDGSFKKT